MNTVQKLTQLRVDVEEHFHTGIRNIEMSAGDWMADILETAGFTDDEKKQILGPNYKL
jgi:hypothetical protein